MIQASISNIQRFSLDDGPGIRTTVFFKGCNLSCAWCHNPECISPKFSLQFTKKQCTSCQRCKQVCPNNVHHFTECGEHLLDRTACQGCKACEKACLQNALLVNGTFYSAEMLLKEIKKDLPFFEDSGGGVTFSGGEPMLSHVFLREILPLVKNSSITVAIDTAGNVPYEWYEELLPYIDYILLDIKCFHSLLHEKYTSVPNLLILENARKLSRTSVQLIVRTPVIPGFNDSMDELEAVADFLAEIQPSLTQLLPYHNYGYGKYESFGIANRLPNTNPPPALFINQALNMFRQKGVYTTF